MTTLMTTLKEEALEYLPPQTHNIAELDKVSIDIEILDAEGKDTNGDVFKYKYVEVDGIKYRIPGSVIGGLKAMLEKIPDLKHFSVLKQGEGMNTRYQVIPINN